MHALPRCQCVIICWYNVRSQLPPGVGIQYVAVSQSCWAAAAAAAAAHVQPAGPGGSQTAMWLIVLVLPARVALSSSLIFSLLHRCPAVSGGAWCGVGSLDTPCHRFRPHTCGEVCTLYSLLYTSRSCFSVICKTSVQLVYISGGAAPRGCRLRKRVHTVHSVQYSTQQRVARWDLWLRFRRFSAPRGEEVRLLLTCFCSQFLHFILKLALVEPRETPLSSAFPSLSSSFPPVCRTHNEPLRPRSVLR